MFVPGADLFNHGGAVDANAVLITPEEGVRPQAWSGVMLSGDEEGEGGQGGEGGEMASQGGASLENETEKADQGEGSEGGEGKRGGRSGGRRARALARGSAAANKPRRRKGARAGREADSIAPLAAGLSDVALGKGGGVWRWREMERGGSRLRGMDSSGRLDGPGLPPIWMERVWMQASCFNGEVGLRKVGAEWDG